MFWIIYDDDENVVGKYSTPGLPPVPDKLDAVEVDRETIRMTDVDYWFDETE